MTIMRHTPDVPGIPTSSDGSSSRRWARPEETGPAIDVILAAAANLRHYRDRLTAEEYTATVRDIEQAAQALARGLAPEGGPARAAATGAKRRVR